MPREGHDKAILYGKGSAAISIHVPREGHDVPLKHGIISHIEISIHVPREGHDTAAATSSPGSSLFLSTCPVRGTT